MVIPSKAEDIELGRFVALSFLPDALAGIPGSWDGHWQLRVPRFVREPVFQGCREPRSATDAAATTPSRPCAAPRRHEIPEQRRKSCRLRLEWEPRCHGLPFLFHCEQSAWCDWSVRLRDLPVKHELQDLAPAHV